MISVNELKEDIIVGNIPGWEDYYIFENGDVYSIRRKRMMKVWVSHNKYIRVSLSKDGVEKNFVLHRLVAMAHIPNPHNKRTVNHIDGNKHNNHVSNLEWATWSENQTHAYNTGLATVPNLGNGETHPAAKLNNVDIEMIKVLRENGFTNEQIGKRFSIHAAHVSAINLDKTWKHLN